MKLLAIAASYLVAAIAEHYEERARALRARAERADRSALEIRAFTGGILTPHGSEPQEAAPGDPFADEPEEPAQASVTYSGTPPAPGQQAADAAHLADPLPGSADDE